MNLVLDDSIIDGFIVKLASSLTTYSPNDKKIPLIIEFLKHKPKIIERILLNNIVNHIRGIHISDNIGQITANERYMLNSVSDKFEFEFTFDLKELHTYIDQLTLENI